MRTEDLFARKWEEQRSIRSALDRWRAALQRFPLPLTPPMLALIWVEGLQAAGVNAGLARVWTRGRSWPSELPLVVEFPCPVPHRTADRRDLAKVRLLVEDDGWPTLDEDSPCPRCTADSLEEYLLTCPRCEAGDDSDDHPAGHPYGLGDASPLSFVDHAFAIREAQTVARWWIERTDEAAAAWGEHVASRIRGDTTPQSWAFWEVETEWLEQLPVEEVPWLADDAPLRHEDVELLLPKMLGTARGVSGQVQPKAVVSRVDWTDGTAADWLDGLTSDDGDPLVPADVTQRDAWSVARQLPQHPPKNVVERAQTLRKNRPADDAD